jgi:hypothetical protein
VRALGTRTDKARWEREEVKRILFCVVIIALSVIVSSANRNGVRAQSPTPDVAYPYQGDWVVSRVVLARGEDSDVVLWRATVLHFGVTCYVSAGGLSCFRTEGDSR